MRHSLGVLPRCRLICAYASTPPCLYVFNVFVYASLFTCDVWTFVRVGCVRTCVVVCACDMNVSSCLLTLYVLRHLSLLHSLYDPLSLLTLTSPPPLHPHPHPPHTPPVNHMRTHKSMRPQAQGLQLPLPHLCTSLLSPAHPSRHRLRFLLLCQPQ